MRHATWREWIGSNPFRSKALGPYGLTLSELDAMQTLADWAFNRRVAAQVLNVSQTTLTSHLVRARQKMFATSIAEGYAIGVREGFLR